VPSFHSPTLRHYSPEESPSPRTSWRSTPRGNVPIQPEELGGERLSHHTASRLVTPPESNEFMGIEDYASESVFDLLAMGRH